MTLEELLSETCGKTGNVVSWKTLKEEGISVKEYQTFQDCNGNYILNLFIHSVPN